LWLGSWDRINLKKIKPKQNIKLNSQQIKILNNKIKKNKFKSIRIVCQIHNPSYKSHKLIEDKLWNPIPLSLSMKLKLKKKIN